jgi:hypothetical protein
MVWAEAALGTWDDKLHAEVPGLQAKLCGAVTVGFKVVASRFIGVLHHLSLSCSQTLHFVGIERDLLPQVSKLGRIYGSLIHVWCFL